MDFEEALRHELTKALIQEDRAQMAFAAPYSGFDATKAYFDAQGFCRGLARAIELLEARTLPAEG